LGWWGGALKIRGNWCSLGPLQWGDALAALSAASFRWRAGRCPPERLPSARRVDGRARSRML